MSIDNYFEISGNGPPVVLVHGSYATTAAWKGVIGELSANHTCISIKLPGHCGTPEPQDFASPTVETELEILEAVVRKHTNEPVHLVGHSYGGVVALAQALKGGLNVSQVTLFEPVAVWVLDRVQDAGASNTVKDFLRVYYDAVDQKQPFACGHVIDFWGGKGLFGALPDAVKESMEPLVANNLRHWDVVAAINTTVAELKACQLPTRLVCGTRSNPVATSICDHLNALMPGSRKYVIEGASHFLVTSHFQQCAEIIEDQSIF